MFEHRTAPLLDRRSFAHRMLWSFLVACALICGSLTLGILGYHFLGELGWLDSLVNASMILTGMGPVDPMRTVQGKLFSSAYALFSGVVFLSGVAVVFAPVFHRFLHRFHLEREQDR